MHRRTLLATVGSATVPLAGCLSAAEGTNTGSEPPIEPEGRRYEECSREVIPYDMFPRKIQAEINAAVDGQYEADHVYLTEAMDIDESYVSVDDTYYNPSVTVDADRERLALVAVEPKALPDQRPMSVEHYRDGERTITVTLTAADGTTLIDETRTLHPGGDIEFGSTRRVGSHELRVTVTDGDKTEDELVESVEINESRFDVLAVVEVDEIYVTGAVADLGICQFEATA